MAYSLAARGLSKTFLLYIFNFVINVHAIYLFGSSSVVEAQVSMTGISIATSNVVVLHLRSVVFHTPVVCVNQKRYDGSSYRGHINWAGIRGRAGFVRLLESLESPGILLWHFLQLWKKATGPGKFWKSV